MKDTISRTAIYYAIVYQLWNESVMRTYFGELIAEVEAPYVIERAERWHQATLRRTLPFYG